MFLGVTLFVRLQWVSVIYGLVFWLYYERIILAEEVFLKEIHGKD
jgi:protein-S-isoprenylcysteine O-methyltransferase Ste14